MWELDFTMLICFILMQGFRLSMGMSGNRNESAQAMTFFVVFDIMCIVTCLYLTFFTIYVLYIELIIGGILLFFLVLEFPLSLWALGRFSKAY